VTKPEAETILAALAGLRLDLRELERLGCLCDCLHGVACPIHAEADRAEARLSELEERVRGFRRPRRGERSDGRPPHQYDL
jgi:hypothetical protein